MIELSMVDGTGHAWRPREGDLVRETESGRYGVVLEVRQTANAPAYAQVALTDDARAWSVVEVGVEQLERDTRDDVEVPSLREITMELGEAAARVLGDVQLLAQLRARVATNDELVGVLEIEATRCMRVGDAAIEVHRYDIAARERERASSLRWLAAAVRTVIEQTSNRL